MNTTKMRRYIARTTPDTVYTIFANISNDPELAQIQYRGFVDKFVRLMEAKHRRPLNVSVHLYQDIENFGLVTLRVSVEEKYYANS